MKAAPFGNAGPALDAVMHGDVLGLAQALDIRKRKLDRVVDEATHLQPVILESVPRPTASNRRARASCHWARSAARYPPRCNARCGDEAVERSQHQRIGDELLRMLQDARVEPRDVMRRDPRKHDHADADEAQDHSQVILVVGAQHDVVHVANKAGHHDQRHMHDDERKEAEHREEVNGARRLPAAKELRIPGKAIDRAGDMAIPVRIASGPKTKTTEK